MQCFYHSADLDGHCSGAIVKRGNPDCELIGINYGDVFPWDTIEVDEEVHMVDFSLQPFSDMIKLDKHARLSWIDHHKSALKEYEDTYLNEERGAFRVQVGKAACELVWEIWNPESPTNYPVWLLGRYDVWDHCVEEVLNFQYGCRLYDTVPTEITMNTFWNRLFSNDTAFIHSILAQGKTIRKYEAQHNAVYAKARSFTTELNGYKVLACNVGLANSKFFDSVVDPLEHDILCTFCLLPTGMYTVSLYQAPNVDVDVSVIAKSFGGGGHSGAAGFQCLELPFKVGEMSEENGLEDKIIKNC